MGEQKRKKKPAKAKKTAKKRKQNKRAKSSMRKYLHLSKKDRQTLKLGLSIALLIFLSLLFFRLCTQKDSYAGRYFYADTAFNVKVEGKELYELHGLDVSHHQGAINWAMIDAHKINDRPISFVFIKASEGLDHQDTRYAYNKKEAGTKGLITGAYHYYKDNVSAELQAKHFIRMAKLRSGDLAPVLDVEELDKERKDKTIKSLLKIMALWEKRYGTKPIFYTYDYLYRQYFQGTELEQYPLWIANYSLPDEELPPYDWSFWQYSSRGRLNDCIGDFDLNVFRTSIADFEALLIP